VKFEFFYGDGNLAVGTELKLNELIISDRMLKLEVLRKQIPATIAKKHASY
jgi:hypothetical protein